MTNIESLVQFLLSKQPPENQARLALYHYLKNLKNLSDPLNGEVLNEFFMRSLGHQYWQDNRVYLAQGIMVDLVAFQKNIELGFELNSLKWPSQVQVVVIESFENLFEIVKKSIERDKEASTRYQMIKLPNDKLLVLLLKSSGALTCEVYSTSVCIEGGGLRPLLPETRLAYNARMELREDVVQTLTPSLMSFSQFSVSGGHCSGVTLKGFTYQKEEVISGTLLQRPDLFYPIKSIERFFIKPESDPFYLELTRILQKAHDLVQTGHPDQEKISMEAYKRGKMALKNIFPDDKLLQLLVSNLEHSLRLRGDVVTDRSVTKDNGRNQCQQISPLSR